MTAPLFVLEEIPDGDVVVVTGSEAKHAVVVQRLRRGEYVLLTNGRGTLLHGKVESTDTSRQPSLTVKVYERQEIPPPSPQIWVAQGIPKGERADLAVQMLTEVGVDRIIPWQADRCVVKWPENRVDKAHSKWSMTAQESAKQARRPWFPAVTKPMNSRQLMQYVQAEALTILLLHETADKNLSDALQSLSPANPLLLVVGPEGGISDEEIAAFQALSETAVHMGPTVMRTSTAGAIGAAIAAERFGRWNK